jgi:hypothetical protein
VTSETQDSHPNSRPRRIQFGLRAMFGLTTAVAIACAIFFALPYWVGGLTTAMVIISMPGVLTIVVVYGRGNTRAFGIGALFPASVCLFPFVSYYGVYFLGDMLEDVFDDIEPRILFLIFLNVYFTVVLGNGFLAVCMRRWLQSGQRLLVPPSPGCDQQPQAADDGPDADRTGSEER